MMGTATATPPRICKDCRHFREEFDPSAPRKDPLTYPVRHWCLRLPETKSLVTGEKIAARLSCHDERRLYSPYPSHPRAACGIGGIYWEPSLTYEEPK